MLRTIEVKRTVSSGSNHPIEIISVCTSIDTVIEVLRSIISTCESYISPSVHVIDPESVLDIRRFYYPSTAYISGGKIDNIILSDVYPYTIKCCLIIQDFCLFLKVFFFCEYCIINRVAYIFEVITPYAFVTSDEVGRKPDIRRAVYIFTIENLIRLSYVVRIYDF